MDERSQSRRRVLVGAASAGTAGIVSLAGCVGDEDADDDAGADDADGDDTEADDDVVEVETREGQDGEPDFDFDPVIAELEPGTTVRWVNTDGVFHTVTSTDDINRRSGGGDVFDATISSTGATVEWEADEPGSQPYYCSPHARFMYGEIEVE